MMDCHVVSALLAMTMGGYLCVAIMKISVKMEQSERMYTKSDLEGK